MTVIETSLKLGNRAGAYYLLQGVAVGAWWLVLWRAPSMRGYFALEAGSDTSLLAFWLADILLLALSSIITGVLFLHRYRFAYIPALLVAGGFGYAVLYTIGFVLLTDTGWLGVVLMAPAAVWSGVFALTLSPAQELLFWKAKSASTGWILFKTFTQIVVVWTLILLVFPYLITTVEGKLGIPHLNFPFQQVISVILFILISIPGVLSASNMARIGEGTPLPLDSSNKLVVRGIYAYVRNPMAISGIGQGLAVALWFGSPLVALYALMGSMIWQLVMRPLEEVDLERKFGAEYRDYRNQVKCWIPRTTPYAPSGRSPETREHLQDFTRRL